ncbi:hypothetical protein CHLRE_12g552827v5 [Chlamydomonas reinhardtii]|uniref:Uncharacterized protein n=1 Tax=Chlamydomonas reinhardtii TaxID=3055 RepID=A0A2K3D743_CHLRE|nr:uncharacterized protein CHLRE_12g552827v5 [Chlamydomonas reinhardtii]PNW76347.1 hypothetical protein CHLRE_12g552827v5 [Chlamydomonas reinhardtii]
MQQPWRGMAHKATGGDDQPAAATSDFHDGEAAAAVAAAAAAADDDDDDDDLTPVDREALLARLTQPRAPDENFLLHLIWEPWARQTRYFHDRLAFITRPDFSQEDDMQYVLGLAIRSSMAVPSVSWAIPSAEALEVIAQQSGGRVVEVGAGTGYWAWLLARRGVDVVAVDNDSEYRFKTPPAEGKERQAEDKELPAEDKELPAEGKEPPAEGKEPPAEGKEPPVEGKEPPAEDKERPAEDKERPAEGKEPPAEGKEPPAEDKEPPAEGKEPPVEGKEPPVEGKEPPAEGKEPPAEGKEPPVEGKEPPAEGKEPPAEDKELLAEGKEPPAKKEGVHRFFRSMHVCDGPEFLVRHGGCPDRALLLCWARHDMGEASLAAYRGDTVVAVGEVDEGATWELKTWKHPEWRQVRRVPLPNWLGIRDDLRVYRRVAGQKEEEGGE